MAAITEHYNRNQDRAEDETTGSGVRLHPTENRRDSPALAQRKKSIHQHARLRRPGWLQL